MNDKKVLKIIGVFILICILLFGFIMFKLIEKNNQCVKNPFVYSAKTIIDNSGNQIYSVCSCDVLGDEFYFDREGMYLNNPLFEGLSDPLVNNNYSFPTTAG